MFIFFNFENEKYLINKKNIDKLIKNNDENKIVLNLIDFCYFNNFKMVKYIINNFHIQDINKERNNGIGNIFSNASTTNNTEMIKFLIDKRKDINLHYNNNVCLKNICSTGNIEIFKYLIKKNIINNLDNNLSSLLFTQITHSGDLEFVKYFLDLYPNTDISFLNEYSFINACKSKNYDLIEFLLIKIPNIDLTINDYESFKVVSSTGNLKIFKLLYQLEPNLDIYIDNDEIIKNCIISSSLELVKFFIEEFDIDFLKNDCIFFQYALTTHNYDLIKYILICEPRIYIKKSQIQLIKDFILLNKFEIFLLLEKFILKEDLFKNYYLLISDACYSGNMEAFNYLLKINPDFNIKDNLSFIFCRGCCSNNLKIVDKLYNLNKKNIMNFYNDQAFKNSFNYKRKHIFLYLISKKPYYINKYKDYTPILNDIYIKKIKIIQRWWKNIIYNPKNKICEKFIMKQIEWAF